MAAASVLIIYKRGEDMLDFLKRRWRLIAVSELIFLAFFIGWTLFRAYDPAIDHTEQPMDFAFLNASIRSTFGQPEDPWLRGETVSYYYFGHWMMGALSEISGVASNVSYNLSLALIPALAAVGMFSVVVTLVRSDGAGMRLGMVVGVASGFVLGIVSNLAGVLEFMRANAIGSQGFYDWIGIEGLDGRRSSPQPRAGYPRGILVVVQGHEDHQHLRGRAGDRLHDPGVPVLQLHARRPPPARVRHSVCHSVHRTRAELLHVATCWTSGGCGSGTS